MAYWDNASKRTYLGDYGSKFQPEDSISFASSSPAMSSSAPAAADIGGAATSGAMAGGPAGAALMAGGSFLSNYLAQKAADERAKRDRAMQIEQQYAQNQNQGFDTMMKAWGGALR